MLKSNKTSYFFFCPPNIFPQAFALQEEIIITIASSNNTVIAYDEVSLQQLDFIHILIHSKLDISLHLANKKRKY